LRHRARRLSARAPSDLTKSVWIEELNLAVGGPDEVPTLEGAEDLVDRRPPNTEESGERFLRQCHFAASLLVKEQARELLGEVMSGELKDAPVGVGQAERDAR
jgi:hypothetical protein